MRIEKISKIIVTGAVPGPGSSAFRARCLPSADCAAAAAAVYKFLPPVDAAAVAYGRTHTPGLLVGGLLFPPFFIVLLYVHVYVQVRVPNQRRIVIYPARIVSYTTEFHEILLITRNIIYRTAGGAPPSRLLSDPAVRYVYEPATGSS